MTAVLEMPQSKGTTIPRGDRALVNADGDVVELNAEAYEAALNAALGVMGQRRMITTGEAAKLLNCSARTVARILDSGRLPFTRNGATGRRMVDVTDVMDYQRRERERMEQSLSSMRRAAMEMGLYDEDDAAYVANFD
ncbi:MerR family transcriptional regulator [Bifidobacterium tissieri]|uniref:MerR family transcriptional regulator n=1 Tax=Bifidobacterium tissieri TaxID=1630162 RepID=A0A261FBZ6_9BIFI|nr:MULTISPECIES: helix-turn-helix domain-containing protein [Bifidobacterium]OZG56669.1 MerR family transcriptional regulator [Bifidobacterium tissieri]TPF96523.1 MerR family transcriptional regulator [Bifidobacterium sp. UTCIF-39]